MCHYLLQEAAALGQTPPELGRRPHDEVQRKWRLELQRHANRLVDLAGRGHDDEEVHVAPRVRLAVSIGAEKNNLLRMESFAELSRETTNGRRAERLATDSGKLPLRPDSLTRS